MSVPRTEQSYNSLKEKETAHGFQVLCLGLIGLIKI